MTKKKKTCTPEFKQGAVQLVVEQQMKPSEVAHRLGSNPNLCLSKYCSRKWD
ncbi:transposase [Spartinivicinus poritis]|uniref:transposase n=1 Tax=Spartinivicinus poritis TaxID=2994640 RepID=UPI00237CF026|nr:transposase [Spartinivicinus sp. A2-2]